jgi:aryl-alcohol dehydrogenase-like predicted oxidoreductase
MCCGVQEVHAKECSTAHATRLRQPVTASALYSYVAQHGHVTAGALYPYVAEHGHSMGAWSS